MPESLRLCDGCASRLTSEGTPLWRDAACSEPVHATAEEVDVMLEEIQKVLRSPVCGVPGCGRAARTRGRCRPCYGRAYRAGRHKEPADQAPPLPGAQADQVEAQVDQVEAQVEAQVDQVEAQVDQVEDQVDQVEAGVGKAQVDQVKAQLVEALADTIEARIEARVTARILDARQRQAAIVSELAELRHARAAARALSLLPVEAPPGIDFGAWRAVRGTLFHRAWLS